jgi:putative DNA primase/helicase
MRDDRVVYLENVADMVVADQKSKAIAKATAQETGPLVRYGEIDASREFARRHSDDFRFCPEWGCWLAWDSRRWERDTAGRSRLAAKALCDGIAETAREDVVFGVNAASREKAAQKFESKKYVDAVLDLATVEPVLVVHAAQLDADNMLLNTPAGTVDLRTGTLRPHRREDHLTKITNVSPAPGTMTVFRAFLTDITCGDPALAAYLQISLGSCLSGALTDHWLLFWNGTGRNGKNTLGDLVMWCLGDYAKQIPTQTLMADAHASRHPTEIANLRGLRLAVSSEVAEGDHWNESKIKELTGDTMLTGRFMRQDFFEFPRTHKHLIYGNHRPMLRIVDPAMAARLHIVPFNATFTAEAGNLDPQMPDKLRAEAPQVLAWLIDGHEKWQEDGTLRRCDAVEACTRDYLETQATLDHWIEERLEVVPDDGRAGRAWPKSGEVYSDYAQWKKDRGEHPHRRPDGASKSGGASVLSVQRGGGSSACCSNHVGKAR